MLHFYLQGLVFKLQTFINFREIFQSFYGFSELMLPFLNSRYKLWNLILLILIMLLYKLDLLLQFLHLENSFFSVDLLLFGGLGQYLNLILNLFEFILLLNKIFLHFLL